MKVSHLALPAALGLGAIAAGTALGQCDVFTGWNGAYSAPQQLGYGSCGGDSVACMGQSCVGNFGLGTWAQYCAEPSISNMCGSS